MLKAFDIATAKWKVAESAIKKAEGR